MQPYLRTAAAGYPTAPGRVRPAGSPPPQGSSSPKRYPEIVREVPKGNSLNASRTLRHAAARRQVNVGHAAPSFACRPARDQGPKAGESWSEKENEGPELVGSDSTWRNPNARLTHAW